jgi:hypothetical protein
MIAWKARPSTTRAALISGIIALLFVSAAVSSPTPYSVVENNDHLNKTGGGDKGSNKNNTAVPAHPLYCCCTLCCMTKKCNGVNGTRPKQGQNFNYSIGVPLSDEYNYSAKEHRIVMGGSAGVVAPTRGLLLALLAVLAAVVTAFA